ncbi:hypothetical protein [Halorhodospira halophila]|uniref:Uncharacterized protein n=1 Tax=Halorhodospira halophila (strain DSM 244 / SL1) TaxID=349124 RepID=A1WU30_HALHL|nr:hypothetical protein [Halorhodospira halophila]ABM61192.1 hypothetical protein Hhal_0398 [Halorhodospira halophila SL1]MBK1729615.1 hypothetical protein [Halorhodospira halophila]
MSAIRSSTELEALCTCLTQEAESQSRQLILALNVSAGALAAERVAVAQLNDFAEHVQCRLDESCCETVLDPRGQVGRLLREARALIERYHHGLVAARKVVLVDPQLAWSARKHWFEEIVRAETEHEVLLSALEGIEYLVQDHDAGVAVAAATNDADWRRAWAVLAGF